MLNDPRTTFLRKNLDRIILDGGLGHPTEAQRTAAFYARRLRDDLDYPGDYGLAEFRADIDAWCDGFSSRRADFRVARNIIMDAFDDAARGASAVAAHRAQGPWGR